MPITVKPLRTTRRNPKEIAELVEAAEERRKKADQEIERAWTRERENPMPLPETTCCGNCVNWLPPANPKKQHFGECQVLVVVHPGNKSKGDTWHVDDPRMTDYLRPPVEPMRTGARYEGCRAYERRAA